MLSSCGCRKHDRVAAAGVGLSFGLAALVPRPLFRVDDDAIYYTPMFITHRYALSAVQKVYPPRTVRYREIRESRPFVEIAFYSGKAIRLDTTPSDMGIDDLYVALEAYLGNAR